MSDDPTPKERLATILPQAASIISMIGSYIVIREVLVDHRQKKGKAIPRILLELCIADLIFSLGWFLGNWPSPSALDYLWNNVGNIATCNFQAFLLQFGLTASPLFNISLAIFYLLMVRYNWTDAKLGKIEWWIHGGIWIFSLACSIFPIPLGIYNNAWTVCWFESVPPGCKDSYRYGDEATCVRGDNAWIYAVAFTVFPVLTCVILSFVIMGMIYCFVRKTERRMRRYAGSNSRIDRLSIQASSVPTSSRKGKLSFRHFNDGAAHAQVESTEWPPSSYHTESTMASEGSIASNHPLPTAGVEADLKVETTSGERPKFRRAGTSLESTASSQRSFGKSTSRSQVVAKQGIFYILSFVATYALHCFCTLVFFTTRKYWYWLHLSMYVGLSLQGFFNSLVFTRGRNMKTPEGRIFQRLMCWKCKGVRKRMSSHRTPTDTTFRNSTDQQLAFPDESGSSHVAGPEEENTDTRRRVSFVDQEQLTTPEEAETIRVDDQDEESMDTTRRVSFTIQEPPTSEDDETIHDVDRGLTTPEEDETIHNDDHDEENMDTTYCLSLNQEHTVPEETEPVYDDGQGEENSQGS